jgi:hypothetical protein
MLDAAAVWLDERPSLRVAWRVWRNTARRWPLAGAAPLIAAVALAALGRSAAMDRALALAAGAPLAVFAVTAALLAMVVLRRGQRLARARHRDWLAALPNDLSLMARAAGAPLLIWCTAAVVIAAAAATAKLSVRDGAAVMLASVGGCVAALAIATLFVAGEARRERRIAGRPRHAAPSRYAIVRRPRCRWATSASLLPLGYWPVAHAKFLDRPKIRARSVALLLLGAPMNVAGAVVLAAAVVWFITLHLFNLLIGIVRVAFAASWWLAPTPVAAVRFAAAVVHRALAAQVAACALLLGMVYAAEGRAAWRAALLRFVVLMSAACLVSAAVCILALRTREVARSGLHRWVR